MLTTRLTNTVPYDWVFGRAFETGRQLQSKLGWEPVKGLATCFDESGKPDVRGWLEALPSDLNRAAVSVLGEPSDDWV